MASSVVGSSGQTQNQGANTSTVTGYGSVTITNGNYYGLSSTARVTINGTSYDQAGPTSMAEGQNFSWNYPVTFGHNANGERVAIGVSVAFYVNGASFHDGSAGAGTQGALNYNRAPSNPSFGTISRSVRAVTVNVNAVSSPASTAQYTITRSENGGGYGDARSSSSTSATYSGLALGSTQRFQVVASNSDGSSSTVTSGLTTIPNVPGAPTITVSAPTALSRTITAGISASNGAAVSRYVAAFSDDDGATWAAAVTMDASRQSTFAGLTPGGIYRFRVGSENEMGSSALTTGGPFTIPNVPGAPATITVSTPSGRALNISAGESANNGSTVTGYFVQASPDDGETWDAAETMTGSRTFSFSDLAGGTTMQFRIFSRNEVGASAFTLSGPIFIPSGGRRLTAEGFISTRIFKRLTASGWVDVGTARRLTPEGWVELS